MSMSRTRLRGTSGLLDDDAGGTGAHGAQVLLPERARAAGHQGHQAGRIDAVGQRIRVAGPAEVDDLGAGPLGGRIARERQRVVADVVALDDHEVGDRRGVVERGDGDDVGAGAGRADRVDAVGAVVASRGDGDHVELEHAAEGLGQEVLRPAIVAAEAEVDDVHAVGEGLLDGGEDDVGVRRTRAAEDAVGGELDAWRNAGDLDPAGADDARHVGAVAAAVAAVLAGVGARVGHGHVVRRVAGVVRVTDEVEAEGCLAGELGVRPGGCRCR
jgi:hypothetical protein